MLCKLARQCRASIRFCAEGRSGRRCLWQLASQSYASDRLGAVIEVAKPQFQLGSRVFFR